MGIISKYEYHEDKRMINRTADKREYLVIIAGILLIGGVLSILGFVAPVVMFPTSLWWISMVISGIMFIFGLALWIILACCC